MMIIVILFLINLLKITQKLKNLIEMHQFLTGSKVYAALTVYGSCASELPYLGIKVVNADRNNPHSAYNFLLIQNLNEYEEIIKFR